MSKINQKKKRENSKKNFVRNNCFNPMFDIFFVTMYVFNI